MNIPHPDTDLGRVHRFIASVDLTPIAAYTSAERQERLQEILHSITQIQVEQTYGRGTSPKQKVIFRDGSGRNAASLFYEQIFLDLVELAQQLDPYLAKQMRLVGSVERQTATFPLASRLLSEDATQVSISSDMDVLLPVSPEHPGLRDVFVPAIEVRFAQINSALPAELRLREIEIILGDGMDEVFSADRLWPI